MVLQIDSEVGWKDEFWTKMRQKYGVRRLEGERKRNCMILPWVMDKIEVGEQNSLLYGKCKVRSPF